MLWSETNTLPNLHISVAQPQQTHRDSETRTAFQHGTYQIEASVRTLGPCVHTHVQRLSSVSAGTFDLAGLSVSKASHITRLGPHHGLRSPIMSQTPPPGWLIKLTPRSDDSGIFQQTPERGFQRRLVWPSSLSASPQIYYPWPPHSVHTKDQSWMRSLKNTLTVSTIRCSDWDSVCVCVFVHILNNL